MSKKRRNKKNRFFQRTPVRTAVAVSNPAAAEIAEEPETPAEEMTETVQHFPEFPEIIPEEEPMSVSNSLEEMGFMDSVAAMMAIAASVNELEDGDFTDSFIGLSERAEKIAEYARTAFIGRNENGEEYVDMDMIYEFNQAFAKLPTKYGILSAFVMHDGNVQDGWEENWKSIDILMIEQKDDLEKLKALKINPSNASMISYMDGSYADEHEIENGCLYIVELDENGELADSPQKNIANKGSSTDMRMLFSRAVKFDKSAVILQTGRKGDYCFIRPYGEEQVSAVLSEMDRKLRKYIKEKKEEGKGIRIYMDRLANDRYNTGRTMLEMLEAEAEYYSGQRTAKEEAEEMKEQAAEKQQS